MGSRPNFDVALGKGRLAREELKPNEIARCACNDSPPTRHSRSSSRGARKATKQSLTRVKMIPHCGFSHP
jgi:hypothetical protein